MAPDDILEAIRTRPFEPFRICLTDGTAYEIHHPEMCMPMKRAVIVGVSHISGDPLPDRSVKVDPLHIVRIEPLVGKTSPPGEQNGQ